MKTIALLALLMVVAGANGASWSAYVAPESTYWDIHRTSENYSLEVTGVVDGIVSAVDYHGTPLSPFVSRFGNIDVSGLTLMERTAAGEGRYVSEEYLDLQSNLTKSPSRVIRKPAGSPVWMYYFTEVWPVKFSAGRRLQYSGENINDMEVAGNNLDFAGSSLLYNRELSKDLELEMGLKRLNATVYATNDSIQKAVLEPTREMDYSLYAHTTGQADLRYRQSGPDYLTERGSYEIASGAEERYYGDYVISRRIKMNSEFTNSSDPQGWLPCCAAGWMDMTPADREGHSAEGIFSCRC